MGKFKDFLDKQGSVAIIAERLGVTRRLIYFWKEGDCMPSAEMAFRLVRWGKGAFTYEDIVKGVIAAKRKKARK